MELQGEGDIPSQNTGKGIPVVETQRTWISLPVSLYYVK